MPVHADDYANREIVTTRVFDASRNWCLRLDRSESPREMVGAQRLHDDVAGIRPAAGRAWRLVMHGPNGTDYPGEFRFVEIAGPERLVLDHVSLPKFRLTIFFEELDGKTKIIFRQLFDTPQTYQSVKHLAMPGNEQLFDKFAIELAAMGAGCMDADVAGRARAAGTRLDGLDRPDPTGEVVGPCGFSSPRCDSTSASAASSASTCSIPTAPSGRWSASSSRSSGPNGLSSPPCRSTRTGSPSSRRQTPSTSAGRPDDANQPPRDRRKNPRSDRRFVSSPAATRAGRKACTAWLTCSTGWPARELPVTSALSLKNGVAIDVGNERSLGAATTNEPEASTAFGSAASSRRLACLRRPDEVAFVDSRRVGRLYRRPERRLSCRLGKVCPG